MKKNPLKDGVITENSARVGTVTGKMVRARAAELAVIDGPFRAGGDRIRFGAGQTGTDRHNRTGSERGDVESAPESER